MGFEQHLFLLCITEKLLYKKASNVVIGARYQVSFALSRNLNSILRGSFINIQRPIETVYEVWRSLKILANNTLLGLDEKNIRLEMGVDIGETNQIKCLAWFYLLFPNTLDLTKRASLRRFQEICNSETLPHHFNEYKM